MMMNNAKTLLPHIQCIRVLLKTASEEKEIKTRKIENEDLR